MKTNESHKSTLDEIVENTKDNQLRKLLIELYLKGKEGKLENINLNQSNK